MLQDTTLEWGRLFKFDSFITHIVVITAIGLKMGLVSMDIGIVPEPVLDLGRLSCFHPQYQESNTTHLDTYFEVSGYHRLQYVLIERWEGMQVTCPNR